jgi:hypothetical protein
MSRMPQVTIYLDAETAAKAKSAAKAAGLSQSRWIAELIRRNASTGWATAVRRAAGCCQDFPDLESLRSELGPDTPREPLG